MNNAAMTAAIHTTRINKFPRRPAAHLHRRDNSQPEMLNTGVSVIQIQNNRNNGPSARDAAVGLDPRTTATLTPTAIAAERRLLTTLVALALKGAAETVPGFMAQLSR